MGWYDLFAYTYDMQLEKLYRPWREQALEMADLPRGGVVLDLACGTGQNFDLLVDAVGPEGRVVGVDLSKGMLGRAEARVRREGWSNVTLVQRDATTLSSSWLEEAMGVAQLDGAVCTMGLSAIPVWSEVLASVRGLVRPGGRITVMDVVAKKRTLQTKMVECLARADLSAEVWRGLDGMDAVSWTDLGAPANAFGGTLYVATGTQPAEVSGS